MAGDTLGEAFVEIKPQTDGFKKQLSGDIDGIADHAERGIGGRVAGSFKGVAAAAAGAFAVVQGVQFFGNTIREAAEAEQVVAQTGAVIKSTGGAANVTAGDVDKLAASISNMTGIDTDAIAAGQNLLLTFTNVKNEAGAGNDIFNQSTQILTDMSVALGTDVSGSAIQLGKALNDPIAGISALTRVGVTFTDEQKNQIKVLTESGDVLGAQKVILAELSKEFGGSAEAAATPLKKLETAFGNFKEGIGSALLPALQPLLAAFTSMLPALQPIITVVGQLATTALGALVPVVQALAPGILALVDGLSQGLKPIISALSPILLILGKAFSDIAVALSPVIAAIGGALAGALKAVAPLFPLLIGVIVQIVNALAPFLAQIVGIAGQLMAALLPAFIAILKALLPLIPALLQIITALLPPMLVIIKALIPVIEIVAKVIEFLAKLLGGALKVGIDLIIGAMKIWHTILGELWKAAEPARTWVAGAFSKIGDAAKTVWEWIKKVAESIGKMVDKIPAWMRPGSPPPFAVGLWHVADALAAMNQNLDVTGPLMKNLAMPDLGALEAAGRSGAALDLRRAAGTGEAAGPSQIITVPVIIDGQEFARVTTPAIRTNLIDIGEMNAGGILNGLG